MVVQECEGEMAIIGELMNMEVLGEMEMESREENEESYMVELSLNSVVRLDSPKHED